MADGDTATRTPKFPTYAASGIRRGRAAILKNRSVVMSVCGNRWGTGSLMSMIILCGKSVTNG